MMPASGTNCCGWAKQIPGDNAIDAEAYAATHCAEALHDIITHTPFAFDDYADYIMTDAVKHDDMDASC